MALDATGLPELTERQEKILALIIREYTNKPEPVGSKFLAETYLLNLSSATIRNEMARLEELGLLAAPHTSAGRVPTEIGYATLCAVCSLMNCRLMKSKRSTQLLRPSLTIWRAACVSRRCWSHATRKARRW